MTPRTKKGFCYYCGKPASSMEHAPPKMMFQAFECDSITVPSCALHNTHKQGHDQAIVNSMLLAIHEREPFLTGEKLLTDDVKEAIQTAKDNFDYTKKLAYLVPVTGTPNPDLPPLDTVCALTPEAHFFDWLRQLTAAIVCKVMGRDPAVNFAEASAWSPSLIMADVTKPHNYSFFVSRVVDLVRREQPYLYLDWHRGWSASPKKYPRTIYYFDVAFKTSKFSPKAIVAFRHTFYGYFTCYVEFIPTNPMLRQLKFKLNTA